MSRDGIRVERGVEKREQVEALIYGYAELLDAGDLAGVAALFDQASYCFGEDVVISGSEELLEIMQATVILYDGSPRTQHVTGNLILEFDDDSCLARSRYTVLQSVEAGELTVVVAGRYHDRFKRDDGRWHFSERRVFMDLVGDASRHSRFELTAG